MLRYINVQREKTRDFVDVVGFLVAGVFRALEVAPFGRIDIAGNVGGVVAERAFADKVNYVGRDLVPKVFNGVKSSFVVSGSVFEFIKERIQRHVGVVADHLAVIVEIAGALVGVEVGRRRRTGFIALAEVVDPKRRVAFIADGRQSVEVEPAEHFVDLNHTVAIDVFPVKFVGIGGGGVADHGVEPGILLLNTGIFTEHPAESFAEGAQIAAAAGEVAGGAEQNLKQIDVLNAFAAAGIGGGAPCVVDIDFGGEVRDRRVGVTTDDRLIFVVAHIDPARIVHAFGAVVFIDVGIADFVGEGVGG